MNFVGQQSIDFQSEYESSESFQIKTLYKKTKGSKKGASQPGKKRKNGPQRHMWTSKQTKAYIYFVSENKREFESQTLRRRSKYFEKMAKRIQTRTPNQCKSHHQKMVQKYGQDFELFLQQIQKSLFKRNENAETNSTFSQTFHQSFSINKSEFSQIFPNQEVLVAFSLQSQLEEFCKKESSLDFIQKVQLDFEQNLKVQPTLKQIDQQNYSSPIVYFLDEQTDLYYQLFKSQ